MSVSPELAAVINDLQSADNDVRSRAEKLLNENYIVSNPDEVLLGLAQTSAGAPQEHTRSFALVLLRRLAFQHINAADPTREIWADGVRHETRNAVSSTLLNQLVSEPVPSVRNKLADTLSELAKDTVFRGQRWEELSQALLQCAARPEAQLRESAWRVWSGVSVLLADIEIESLKQLFTKGLEDEDNSVRLAALKALSSIFIDSDKKLRIQLSPLLHPALEVLPPLAAAAAVQPLRSALLTLTTLASSQPSLFEPHLPSLIPFCTTVAQNAAVFPFEVRQPALELLLSVAEGCQAACRRQAKFVEAFVQVCLEWITQRQQGTEWEETDDLDDVPEEEEPSQVGEEYIDRLSMALGGKTILPPAFHLIPNMISSPEWTHRLAGLMAIAAIGEGSYKVLTHELEKVIALVQPTFADPHPRVRYGACHAIGQLCTDFADSLQDAFYDQILRSLGTLLQDPVPRVQAHAAAALVNFFDSPPEIEAFEPYLDELLQRLLTLLTGSQKRYVQEQAITTIATVADAAEGKFGKYYSAVMPILLNVLGTNLTPDFRLMKGKAMECATLISIAVGRETFLPDAARLAELLAAIQREVTEPDDPQISYLIAAWARIAGALGEQFAPYLPAVMPPLLHAAKQKPDLTFAEGDEVDTDAYPDDLEWLKIADQNVGIQTSALEDKCTAVETLVVYANELKEHFAPYALESLEIALPSLKFYFHDGVREAAAHLIPQLSEIAKNTDQLSEEIADTTLGKVVEAIADEADSAYLGTLVATFFKLVSLFGVPNVKPALAQAFIKAVEAQLQEIAEKRKMRVAKHGKAANGDFDVEDLDEVLEEEAGEDQALDEISAAIKVLDPSSGLLMGIGSIKEMSVGPEWQDEE